MGRYSGHMEQMNTSFSRMGRGVLSALVVVAVVAGCASVSESSDGVEPVRSVTVAYEGAYSVVLRYPPMLGVDEYVLLRAEHEAGPYTEIKRTPDRVVIDLDRAPESSAWYRVVAVADGHESVPTQPVRADTTPAFPPRESNFYGIHTMLQPSGDVERELDWVRTLVGPGGYVKQMFYNITKETDGATSFWITFVREAYERDLVPVIRLHGRFGDGHSFAPQTNTGEPPTGTDDYSEVAQAFRSVVEALPRAGGRPLYVEIWNEPNLHNEWGGPGESDPTEYGYFLVAVAQAIREIGDPRVRILNGALSPGGNYNNIRFVQDMITTVPESLYAFDVWASHPYPGASPPYRNNAMVDDLGFQAQNVVDAYRRELAVLADAGRTDLEVMLTETGYVWDENDPNKQNVQPHLPQQSYTDFTVQAFVEFWARWPEVRAVMPFQMYNPSGGWEDRAWIGPGAEDDGTGRPTTAYPVYDEIAKLVKPPAATYPELAGTDDVNMEIVRTGNLAIGAEVAVSTTIDQWGWHSRFINDGITAGLGWTTEGEPLTDEFPAEWVEYDLGQPESVGRVVLHPRSGDGEAGKFFPQGFDVQVSDDGEQWETVFVQDPPVEATYRLEPLVAEFPAIEARFVRLWITDKDNFGEGGYHAQLAELEVYAAE